MRQRDVSRLFIAFVLIIVAALATALPGTNRGLAGEACTDPTPGAGGELEFTFYGFLSENHFASADGDVCPDETEVWAFTSLVPPATLHQYIGARVIVESGQVLITLRLPNGEEISMEPGEEYRAIHRDEEDLVTYSVMVTGTGTELARYRVEACRGGVPFGGPCIFERRGLYPTPVISPSATAPPTHRVSPTHGVSPTAPPGLPATGSGTGKSGRALPISVVASVASLAALVLLAAAAMKLRRVL